MSIARRIQAIEQHLEDDYSVLELAGADLTNVDKNIQNLKPTWKERLLYFMNNGTDEVWNNWDKVTGEGEEISLNNTLEAKMKIELKGNTYQETRNDKNKVAIPDVATTTQNGITYSVKNGVISLSGTCGSSSFRLDLAQLLQPFTITSGTNYVLSGVLEGTTTKNYEFQFRSQDNTSNIFSRQQNQLPYTFNNISGEVYNFSIYIAYDTVFTNHKIKLQFEEETTPTEWQQGGATPTPSIPSAVHVVSGDNSIEVCGKNLMPFTNQDFTLNNVRYYVENGSLILNGTSTGETSSVNTTFKTNLSFTLPSGTYTISHKTGIMACYLYKTDNTLVKQVNTNVASETFTLSEETQVFLGFYVYQKTFANINAEVMIEKGTSSSEYQPCQSQTYPINLGDIELCKIGTYQDRFIRNSGKNLVNRATCDENKILVWATGLTTNNTDSLVSDYIEVSANEKVISTYRSQAMFYDSNKEYLGCLQIGGTTIAKVGGDYFSSFTIPNNTQIKYVRLGFRSSVNNNVNMTIQNIMSNKGDTLLPYEPYGSGEWYLEKKIGKVVLDGTTDGLKFTSAEISRNKRFSLILNDVLKQNYSLNIDNKSNYFTYNTDVYRDGGDEIGFIINSTQLYVRFGSSSVLDTITKANAWLSTHNTTFYYILATPTYTKIEGELANQLDKLSGAKSYNSQTNISQDNNDLASVLNASALEDM